jgi:2-hydroxychromene-2-carboxylate isomerase
MVTIDYYFSVLSDWAYMGGERFEFLARRYGATINHMPVRLAAVYEGTGGILLQKRSKQRQDYRVIELKRWRDELGIPISLHPRHYPTDDAPASHAILAVKKLKGDTGRFASLILRAIWAEERDIADENTLFTIAEGAGLNGRVVLELSKSEEIRQQFDRYTHEAQTRGVFGSPFYIIENEIFWGQDRLEFVEKLLAASLKPFSRI